MPDKLPRSPRSDGTTRVIKRQPSAPDSPLEAETPTTANAQSAEEALPMRDEAIRPTAVPPPESFATPSPQTRARLKGRRSSLPNVLKLTEPPPPFALLEQKVAELIALQGEHPGQDLIGDMMLTALRMVRDGSSRGELKILAGALRELRYAFNVFRPFDDRRKITIFGSARTPPDAPEYQQAKAFAAEMARRNFMTITGAGPGIMEAAQDGAGPGNSFGVNIRLPFEQHSNRFIEGDPKLINFRYFFTRKLCFVKEASAVALFPGGFGTHDEMYETMTLLQTGKTTLFPIVFIDRKGGTYWREWADYVAEHLLNTRLISEEDMGLFKITDDVVYAADEITNFYKRYHSSRYVNDLLVIRMASALSADTVGRLNAEFTSILVDGKGRIESCDAFPEESSEPELFDLPRLSLPFNRRNFGKLRQLIDEINRAE